MRPSIPLVTAVPLVAAVLLLVGACGAEAPSAGPGLESNVDTQVGETASSETPTVDAATDDQASLVLYADPDKVIDARSAPSDSAEVVATVQSRTGQPQPFLALMPFAEFEALTPDDKPGWVEVLLPVRPNGQTGWIKMSEVSPFRVGYDITIEMAEFRLTVSKDGQSIVDTPVALGNADTPTPVGRFYLTELIKSNDPDGAYGPFAFGISGYSETLETFGTGNGVIGIHGTNDPEAIGTFVSHGCVRVLNEVIEELAAVLPLGTPVTITA